MQSLSVTDNTAPHAGMVVDLDVDEGLVVTVPGTDKLGRKVTVTLLYKAGRRARLRIATDEDVLIERTSAELVRG